MALPKEQTLELLEKSRDMYSRILHYRIYQYGRDMIKTFLNMTTAEDAEQYFFMETERIANKIDFLAFDFDKIKEMVKKDGGNSDAIEDTFYINRETLKNISIQKEHRELLKMIQNHVDNGGERIRISVDIDEEE